MMLEDQGKSVENQEEMFKQARKKLSPGKLERVMTGNFVMYTAKDARAKEASVGKVTALSKTEGTVIVHRYRPVSDNCMRLHWLPVYVEDGAEVLGTGTRPSTETVSVKQILFPVQLHDGVLGHAVARNLERLGYRYPKAPTCGLDGLSLIHI